MFPSFDSNGYTYHVVEIMKSQARLNSVVLDPSFHNKHRSKLSSSFKEAPSGCRSAFQRIKFKDMMSAQQIKEAEHFLDHVCDQYKGILIPNADHRWQKRIEALYCAGKEVYYTNDFLAGKLFLVQRF